MATRSFRIFATKEDLITIFSAFQHNIDIHYYKCGRSSKLNEVKDITTTAMFGINTSGSHINNQWLICPADIIPQKRLNEQVLEKGVFFIDQMLNCPSIIVDIGGTYQDIALFPTEISTLWYENEIAQKIYGSLRKSCQKHSKTIQKYMVAENAYLNRTQYRFCTINLGSPVGYDFRIE